MGQLQHRDTYRCTRLARGARSQCSCNADEWDVLEDIPNDSAAALIPRARVPGHLPSGALHPSRGRRPGAERA